MLLVAFQSSFDWKYSPAFGTTEAHDSGLDLPVAGIFNVLSFTLAGFDLFEGLPRSLPGTDITFMFKAALISMSLFFFPGDILSGDSSSNIIGCFRFYLCWWSGEEVALLLALTSLDGNLTSS